MDPLGEMLEASWEKYATAVANCLDAELPALLGSIVADEKIDLAIPASVVVAIDTRQAL